MGSERPQASDWKYFNEMGRFHMDIAKYCDEVEAERDQLRARVAELEGERAWRGIEELDGDHDTGSLLLWCPEENCSHRVGCRDDGQWLSDENCSILHPTHWQPLPNGPEVGNG